ncbi:MAG: aldo/keto reductase [Gammaproteobacteria bacterium]
MAAHEPSTHAWQNTPAAQSGTFRIGGDLLVNRMAFGAMRITGPDIWGPPANRPEAIEVLRRAVELGVNLIDTADSYGPDVSELLIAEALHPYPPGLVIATKAGLVRPSPGEWKRDARPAHLKAACEGSLKRLRLERIDLFQLHAPDPQVPYSESVGALADLQREGKIRHIGVSNVDVARLDEARGIVRVVSVQNRYNLNDRLSAPVLEECERDGLAFLPWYPLGAGPLARSHGALERIAGRREATSVQVALAWLLERSPVTVPIPGTSSVAHLEENVAAAALRLTSADLRDLDS